MPDPHERHSRSSNEDWGSEPSRSQQRSLAAAEPLARRPPGKKDRSLCKAAHWKPHSPEFRVSQYGWSAERKCLWAVSWCSEDGEPSWHCCHAEFCAGCGKILRLSIDDEECPAYHPITQDEHDAIAARSAEDAARVAAARTRSRWQPKPAITGPQGFRRKRQG